VSTALPAIGSPIGESTEMNVESKPLTAAGEAAQIACVGVIGAGQMGSGIAHVCALAGLPVVLLDISEELLQRAMASMERNMERQVSRKSITPAEKEAALKRISLITEYAKFGDCDLVVETVSENEALKKSIYAQLVPYLRSSCLLASNTSSISITRLAAATDRPGKFIGMHFMNPVPVMKLVEIIRGMATEEDTFGKVMALAERLGKTSVVSQDFPAFIVNRVLVPMINEAIYALYESVGSVTSIDNALRLGANHPMGPLELADFVGLDTCLAIMKVLYEGYSDSKYRPCPLLVKYVEAGWLGRKVGRGFYDYTQTPPGPTRY
jgi:3-hydroxybutyryl-CoA dehydrogenase